jgi:hypothetical protein
MSDGETLPVIASCHCGSVSIRLAAAPTQVTHCNCSLCRRYGVLWAYYPIVSVSLEGAQETDTYAWNGRNVDFHRCRTCGCVTHWLPRNAKRDRMGINARLLDPQLLETATIAYKNAAGTGLFH